MNREQKTGIKKVEKKRFGALLFTVHFSLFTLLSPLPVFAQVWTTGREIACGTPPRSFPCLVDFLIGYINIIIPLVIGLAVVIYLKNTAQGLFKLQKGGPDPDWQQSMIWGIITIAIMVSIWGILNILAATFDIRI